MDVRGNINFTGNLYKAGVLFSDGNSYTEYITHTSLNNTLFNYITTTQLSAFNYLRAPDGFQLNEVWVQNWYKISSTVNNTSITLPNGNIGLDSTKFYNGNGIWESSLRVESHILNDEVDVNLETNGGYILPRGGTGGIAFQITASTTLHNTNFGLNNIGDSNNYIWYEYGAGNFLHTNSRLCFVLSSNNDIHFDVDRQNVFEISVPGNYSHRKLICNDKVGILNTNPQYDLDVNGHINFTGDLYKNGVLFNEGYITSTQLTAFNYLTEIPTEYITQTELNTTLNDFVQIKNKGATIKPYLYLNGFQNIQIHSSHNTVKKT